MRPFYRKHWLLAASIVFYGFWDLRFLIHFLTIIGINYLFIRSLIRNKNKKMLFSALAFNFLNLFIFKYLNSMFQYFFQITDLRIVPENFNFILPLAISFYTFQIIAFIVDVWRNEIEETDLLDFSLFILFFPQLIAGPIMRHQDFMPQLDRPVLNMENTQNGIMLYLVGAAKKILIADPVSEIISPVWHNPGQYDSLSLLAAVLGFSAQVYADFSGYTDMARGCARMLGYNIPENFLSPYLARSFADLWKRWHITLSTWLRDYLYIPLGGSRTSVIKNSANLIIVMSLGGIWHGNTYNFFLWGFFSGLFLIAERLTGFSRLFPGSKIFLLFRIFIVQIGWLIGVVFFRSANFTDASNVFKGILLPQGSETLPKSSLVFQLFIWVIIFQLIKEKRHIFSGMYLKYRHIIVPALAVVLFFLAVQIEKKTEQFIYFQF